MTGSGGLTGTWLNPSHANPARTISSSARPHNDGDEGSAVAGKSAAEPAPSDWLREYFLPRAPFTRGDAR
jgi:hypothetical protein